MGWKDRFKAPASSPRRSQRDLDWEQIEALLEPGEVTDVLALCWNTNHLRNALRHPRDAHRIIGSGATQYNYVVCTDRRIMNLWVFPGEKGTTNISLLGSSENITVDRLLDLRIEPWPGDYFSFSFEWGARPGTTVPDFLKDHRATFPDPPGLVTTRGDMAAIAGWWDLIQEECRGGGDNDLGEIPYANPDGSAFIPNPSRPLAWAYDSERRSNEGVAEEDRDSFVSAQYARALGLDDPIVAWGPAWFQIVGYHSEPLRVDAAASDRAVMLWWHRGGDSLVETFCFYPSDVDEVDTSGGNGVQLQLLTAAFAEQDGKNLITDVAVLFAGRFNIYEPHENRRALSVQDTLAKQLVDNGSAVIRPPADDAPQS